MDKIKYISKLKVGLTDRPQNQVKINYPPFSRLFLSLFKLFFVLCDLPTHTNMGLLWLYELSYIKCVTIDQIKHFKNSR